MAETADPRRRDYFKPDFFNGIGQNRKLGIPRDERPLSAESGLRLARSHKLFQENCRLTHPSELRLARNASGTTANDDNAAFGE